MSFRSNLKLGQWCRTLGYVPTALLGCFAAQSQPVLVPPTGVGQPARTPEEAAAKPIGSIGAPEIRRPEGGSTPLYWGPVRFNPRLSYHVVHGTGILGAGTADDRTTMHTVTPGLIMELGKFWAADLGVSYNHYTDGDLDNNLGYSFGLSGNIPLDDWTLSLGYASSFTDQPQTETGTQTAELNHNLNFGAVYRMNDRYSMDMGAGVSTRNTEEFTDSLEFTTAEWLNYHWTDRTTFGLGISGGYNYLDPGADSIYLRPQFRVMWQPGPRLTAQLMTGVQMQYFYNPTPRLPSGSGESIEDNEWGVYPVFNASLDYKVSDPLSLYLSAGHSVENSLLNGLFTETSSVNAGAMQRLFKYVHLNVNLGYQFQDYRDTTRGLSSEREDEYFSVYAGLSTQVFRKVQASVFYQYSDNSSSEEGFGFSSNQVGLNLSYQY